MKREVCVKRRRNRPEFGAAARVATRVDGESVSIGVLLTDGWIEIVRVLQAARTGCNYPLLRLGGDSAVLSSVVVLFVRQSNVVLVGPLETLFAFGSQADEDLAVKVDFFEAERLPVARRD